MSAIEKAGAAAVATMFCLASTANALELNFASGLTTSHSVETFGGAPLMACITEKSAGDITFNYFPAGQIVNTSRGVEGLQQGLADMTFVAPVGQSAQMPLTGLALIPGMGTSAAEMAAAFREVVDGENPISAEIAELGIHPVTIISSPPYQLMSTGPRVEAIDGFSGLKLRAAGSSMHLAAESLGAVPVEVVGGDSYVAMQRGTIDATITPTTSAKSYSLQELAETMTTNANFGTPVYLYGMSTSSWDKLSPEQQAIVTECGAMVEIDANAALDKEDAEVAQSFADAGVDMYELTPEVVDQIDAALADVAQDYIDRLESNGIAGAQEAYEALRTALDG